VGLLFAAGLDGGETLQLRKAKLQRVRSGSPKRKVIHPDGFSFFASRRSVNAETALQDLLGYPTFFACKGCLLLGMLPFPGNIHFCVIG